MKAKLVLLLSFIFLITTIIKGEIDIPDLRFQHFTVEDGLSVNTISAITQDSKGFIWLGTSNGLNRYDGHSFKLFKPSKEEARPKSGNGILTVVEGGDGCLWTGTDFGLYILNPQTENFTYFSTRTEQGEDIHSRVYSIIRDRADNMWIATFGQGVFYYDSHKKELRQFVHREGDPRSISSNRIRRLFEDSRGIIWVLAFDNGITAYNREKNEVKHYLGYKKGDNDRYDVIFEDSQGELWLGSYSYGLSKLNYKTGEFTHFLTPDKNSHILHIRSIIEYMPGTLLLASDDGLTFFRPATQESRTIKSNRFNLSGLNDDYLHALFFDKEGGLWIGSYFGGINYTSPAYSNFTHYSYSAGSKPFPGRIVSVMTEDPKGNLWIGTDDAGLVYYDRTNRTYRHYMPQKNKNSLSYHNIHALLYDKGQLWIGTYSGGLDCLDLKTGQFKNYTHTDNERSLSHSSVYALYKDKRGVLWIGTPNGLNRYNPQTDDFERIGETQMCDISLIMEDNKGYMWITTLNNGIMRQNITTGAWKQYNYAQNNKYSLPSNIATTLCVDAKQKLWIGTDGGGLCRYDYENDRFVRYDDKDFPSGIVHKIISDNEYLWISTNIGLVRYQPDNFVYKIYNKSDGLQSVQFNPNSGLKSSDGKLFFGGINGFNSFDPKQLKENTLVPNIVISSFQLFNKEVSCNDENPIIRKAITYEENVVLSHDQSVIGFEFVSLSYMAPEKNKYAYILEGFEKEWTQLKGEPKVTYTNLPPGEYRFRVKASNNDGLWNENGVTLNIQITPPFWRTKLAFLIYILVFTSIGVWMIRNFKKRVERRHQENINRIKVDKEKELYDAKINFFTYIIHEIRTPLSLIIGPLDYVMKSNKRVSEVKEDLAVIKRNSNRLLNLVNQLMDFRKIESSNLFLKLSETDINVLGCQIYEHFRLPAEQKGVRFLFTPSVHHPVGLTDGEAITKILSNLLSNALKFSRDFISLEIIYCPDTKLVTLRVSDNGVGIPLSERENIFKPFYQIRNNQLADRVGTGVGLTLTRSLIDLLHGKLELSDAPGGGSVFSVTIPLNEVDEIVQADKEPIVYDVPKDEECNVGVAPGSSGEDKGEEEIIAVNSQYTLLVVDDNDDIRQFLFQQLSPCYKLICAADAMIAGELLADHVIDLVVSDVMMPGISGFEFCNQIKTNINTSHIPVILLTAKANVEAKIAGLDNGADAYIEKPFSTEHLKAQINSLLINREKLKKRFASNPSVPTLSIANSKADALFLEKMDEFISENMSDTEFSIGEMASELGMSRSSFFAKIRAVSGLTPNDYIRLARLKKAVELFAAGETRINEVCFLVGFNSPSYFAKCFQKQFGELPNNFIKTLHDQQLSL